MTTTPNPADEKVPGLRAQANRLLSDMAADARGDEPHLPLPPLPDGWADGFIDGYVEGALSAAKSAPQEAQVAVGEGWQDAEGPPNCPTIEDGAPARIRWRDEQGRRCTIWASGQQLGDAITAARKIAANLPREVAAVELGADWTKVNAQMPPPKGVEVVMRRMGSEQISAWEWRHAESPARQGEAVVEMAESLFQHIKHGDEKHRAWLRAESVNWCKEWTANQKSVAHIDDWDERLNCPIVEWHGSLPVIGTKLYTHAESPSLPVSVVLEAIRDCPWPSHMQLPRDQMLERLAAHLPKSERHLLLGGKS